MTKPKLKIGLALAGLSILLLNGCNMNSASLGAIGNVSGSVMGGLNPVSGSKITIYEATSGAPIVLGQGVSNSKGRFSIIYHVPALGAYVYVVANGGVTNRKNNPNINLVSVLGDVPNLATPLTVNEITTVGAYQALTNNWSKTADIPTLIAGPNSATALNIGLMTFKNLVNLTTGKLSSNFPLTTTVDSTGYQLETQANVLALCVQNAAYCALLANGAYLNTVGTDTFHLMGGLKTTDATQRTDITTLLHSNNLAALPYPADTLNQSALKVVYNLPISSLSIPIDNVGIVLADSIAIDSLGNVWEGVVNDHTVIKIPVGSTPSVPNLQTFTGFDEPNQMAVDTHNNVWVTDYQGQSVTEIPMSSTPNNPNLQTFTGFNDTNAIAADAHSNIWLTNSQSVTEILAGSTPSNPNLQIFNGFNQPDGITTDLHNNIWVTSFGSNTVTELLAGSTPSTPNLQTFTGINSPAAITADSQNNVWVGNFNGNSVTEIPVNSTPSAPNLQTFNGFNSPSGITADSQDNVWVANVDDQNVTEIPKGSVPGATLPVFSGFDYPLGISSDAQGNIWVINNPGIVEILN